MAYTKTQWKARQGTGLNRYKDATSGNVFVLTNTPTSVTEPGTPISAENMNHLEQGIYEAHEQLDGAGMFLDQNGILFSKSKIVTTLSLVAENLQVRSGVSYDLDLDSAAFYEIEYAWDADHNYSLCCQFKGGLWLVDQDNASIKAFIYIESGRLFCGTVSGDSNFLIQKLYRVYKHE